MISGGIDGLPEDVEDPQVPRREPTASFTMESREYDGLPEDVEEPRVSRRTTSVSFTMIFGGSGDSPDADDPRVSGGRVNNDRVLNEGGGCAR